MKRLLALALLAGFLGTALSGCIVVPDRGDYYHYHHHDHNDYYH